MGYVKRDGDFSHPPSSTRWKKRQVRRYEWKRLSFHGWIFHCNFVEPPVIVAGGCDSSFRINLSQTNQQTTLRYAKKKPFPPEWRKSRLTRLHLASSQSCHESHIPTRSSFSTAHRESFCCSATLDKPLCRECLFYPDYQPLWRLLGSGLCVAREPRLPRIHVLSNARDSCPPVNRATIRTLKCSINFVKKIKDMSFYI
jgi:hypothetical protein